MRSTCSQHTHTHTKAFLLLTVSKLSKLWLFVTLVGFLSACESLSLLQANGQLAETLINLNITASLVTHS